MAEVAVVFSEKEDTLYDTSFKGYLDEIRFVGCKREYLFLR